MIACLNNIWIVLDKNGQGLYNTQLHLHNVSLLNETWLSYSRLDIVYIYIQTSIKAINVNPSYH